MTPAEQRRERALRSAADMVLVADLIARIAQTADQDTVEEYLALFTADAVWAMPANRATGVDEQTRTGVDDIRAGVAQRRAAGVQGPGSDTRHVISTSSVRVSDPGSGAGIEADSGTTATALSYFRFYRHTPAEPELVSMGGYRDRFRLVDGVWRLARREIGLG